MFPFRHMNLTPDYFKKSVILKFPCWSAVTLSWQQITEGWWLISRRHSSLRLTAKMTQEPLSVFQTVFLHNRLSCSTLSLPPPDYTSLLLKLTYDQDSLPEHGAVWINNPYAESTITECWFMWSMCRVQSSIKTRFVDGVREKRKISAVCLSPSPVCGRLRVLVSRGGELTWSATSSAWLIRSPCPISPAVKALQCGGTALSSATSPVRRVPLRPEEDDDAPLLPPPTHNPLRWAATAPPAAAQGGACHVDCVSVTVY